MTCYPRLAEMIRRAEKDPQTPPDYLRALKDVKREVFKK